MRIISGRYRGKKLIPPSAEKNIRPTTDRAKESLFNILFDKINSECVFVDIFCGSGAVGIEALSRGARKVYFVDNNSKAIALLKQNLEGLQGDYEILNMDYKKAAEHLKNIGQQVDIVFCDPPYKENLGKNILNTLYGAKIIKFDGRVIIERNKEFSTEEHNCFYHYDNRIYASSCFDFYKREKRCAITGTFDPFTNGHLDLVKKAKELFDRVYIVLLINENKKIRYPLEKRKEVIRIVVENIKENIVIDSFDGLTIDYCNKNDIQYILRGIRNPKDMLYEYEMADYNYKNGNVTTIIMPSKNSQISSTAVKETLDNLEDVSKLVDKDIINILKE